MLVLVVHPIGALLVITALLAAAKVVKAFSAIAGLAGLVAKWIIAFFMALGPVLFGTTVAYPGYGSKLANGGTAGASYTNIGQLKKFAFGGLKADFDEVTNLDSSSVFKEWMKTTIDGGDVTFDGVLNPTDATTQGLLTSLALAGSASENYWKITTTDGTTFIFQGYVSEFKTGAEYNKAITFSGAIKIVGAVTATWS
jgi:hypothetical protein